MEPLSRIAKNAARGILRQLLSIGDLDLRSSQWRTSVLRARHSALSAVSSLSDSAGSPSGRLLDLTVQLASRARTATLPLLVERNAPRFTLTWPGEHYRLLAALVEQLAPRTVVEIGTDTGLSALAMLPVLPKDGSLATFDIMPWSQLPETFLRRGDFENGRLTQHLGNLGDPAVAKSHAELLRRADLLFVDGPKDGIFERQLLDNLGALQLKPGVIVVFDDIRLWNMLEIWRVIPQPKLDFTSFGHYTGTGLVDWTGRSLPIA